ncbi:hypothetical protein ACHAW6_004205 [Cyclotella cf. meneghiniana]
MLASPSIRPCILRFRPRSRSSIRSFSSETGQPCSRKTSISVSSSSTPAKCCHAHQTLTVQHARHYFSSSDPDDIPTPTISADQLESTLLRLAPSISLHLSQYGYYTATDVLPPSSVAILRAQAVSLRNQGRYEPSYSEKLEGGTLRRFHKHGVYACEPDGRDYGTAPDLITYIATLLRTLPNALNRQSHTKRVELSPHSFNAKLAVTTAGGSRYPCHIDNPIGNHVADVRKLTCILYLNPEWVPKHGGDIRLFLKKQETSNDEECSEVIKVDLSPAGGRLLLFWSDEIPHEVLPTAANESESARSDCDRYALTVWIPTENRGVLHDEMSKFADLKDLVQFG